MSEEETRAIAEAIDQSRACMDVALERAQTRQLTDADINTLLEMPDKILAAMKAVKAYTQRVAKQSDIQLGDEWGGI